LWYYSKFCSSSLLIASNAHSTIKLAFSIWIGKTSKRCICQ